jgi:hypothetical protein
MRKLVISILAALTFVAPGAYADHGYGHGGYGHRGGGSGSAWAGLAIFGALSGLAIMSERNRPVYVDPYYIGPSYPQQPVYIEQPTPPAPANSSNYWYYCGSSAMYYPYTQACPEGWQAVPSRPY